SAAGRGGAEVAGDRAGADPHTRNPDGTGSGSRPGQPGPGQTSRHRLHSAGTRGPADGRATGADDFNAATLDASVDGEGLMYVHRQLDHDLSSAVTQARQKEA